MASLGRKLRIGTDCSGMEAPIQALRNLGVKHDHIFSCDIDKSVKKTIDANYPAQIWYDDLTSRDNSVAPKVDLYVAGFPCQPFSCCGLHQGFDDAKGRGTILWDICDYLEEKRPRVFVLENVVGVLRKDTWETVLKKIETVGNGAYMIQWGRMNTKEHGVPQNRSRVYIVGELRRCSKKTFSFKDIRKLEPASIEDFLEPRKTRPSMKTLPPLSQGHAHRNVKKMLQELVKAGSDPLKEPWVIDLDSTEKFCTRKHDCTPCITRRRGGGHWITNRGRRMTKPEMMRLQGMKPENFKLAVSENQWGSQIGNSMSVNILERIFVRLLPSVGLVPEGKRLTDRWEAAAKQSGRKLLEAVEYSTADEGGVKRAAEKRTTRASGRPAKRTRKS